MGSPLHPRQLVGAPARTAVDLWAAAESSLAGCACVNLSGAAVTRDELYKLVWSMPVLRAAVRFGISDVALAKQCRRQQVPLPPRGYWARKAAGQDVRPTPLAPFVQPPPPPKRLTVQELREQEQQRAAKEKASALATQLVELPLVCFEDDVAKALGIALKRVKQLVHEGRFPIRQLPYYGLRRKARYVRRGETTEAKPCWSKNAVLSFLAKDDRDREFRLLTRYEAERPQCNYSCLAHCPSRRHEHGYVRYLKNRGRWGH
jgi:hypothetical protein